MGVADHSVSIVTTLLNSWRQTKEAAGDNVSNRCGCVAVKLEGQWNLNFILFSCIIRYHSFDFFSDHIKMYKQFSAHGLHKNWQWARAGSRFIVCWPLIWKIILIILWALGKYYVDYYGMKKVVIKWWWW